jgi:molybdopterin-guanine dinucleotide biosynthesis protein
VPLATIADLAIVILAGGRATRFPGKLEAWIGGKPLLAHVYQRLCGVAPVIISGRGSFSAELDDVLDCPIVIDRRPDLGPLGGIVSACVGLSATHVFVVAGDAPRVDAYVVETLAVAWEEGDDACVPEHDGRFEPLAALYAREALLRAAEAALQGTDRSMHGLLARLNVRYVPIDARYFINVNTAADAARMEATR